MAAPPHAWRLAALAWVAGAIDAFGYLALGRVFISHATGNTAVVAIAIVHRNVSELIRRGSALPAFFLGGLAGTALVEAAENRRQVARALLVEAALLSAFVAVAWGLGFDPAAVGPAWVAALALLGVAMGIQNAALAHPLTRGTHTTHITGPLTDFAADIVRWIRPSRRPEFDGRRMLRQIARLIGFPAGALSGALLFDALPIAAPLVPAAVLVVIAIRELASDVAHRTM